MEINIIITTCLLLLLAYVFNITASKTKIPAVIMLLLLGFGLKQISSSLAIELPDLQSILPVLGTLGLVLIVLEGALELKLHKDKFDFIAKSSFLALLPMLILSFVLAYSFSYFGNLSLRLALINSIPLCIISSAIAIPSAKSLKGKNAEFITYESSFSDIFGVIIFNFIALNSSINLQSFEYFFIELIIMLLVSVFATIILALFIAHIKHHIKFIPIIISVTLIYAVAKLFHLPALIFILLFGLALNNLDLLKNFKLAKGLNISFLNTEVHRFSEITTEFAFLVRALFFLLFGFLIQFEDIINLSTLPWALGIVFLVFVLRAVFLKIFKLTIAPLLFIAPRGLITVLLFLSIPAAQRISFVNNALLIQVILICAVIMMIGLMVTNTKKNEHTIEVDAL